MAYCVECGVKLAPSESECPLCGTRVLHPDRAWEPPDRMPWPHRSETVMKRIDRAYAGRLSLFLMLIPAATAMLMDLLDGGGLRWSLFAAGALFCLWCWFLLPVFFRLARPYAYVAADLLCAGAYLLLIAALGGGLGWYLRLALPVLLLLGLKVQLSLLAARARKFKVLHRTALVLSLAALFPVGLEFLIDLYVSGSLRFHWAFYAALPLLALAGTFVYIQRNTALKEEIRKRLFI